MYKRKRVDRSEDPLDSVLNTGTAHGSHRASMDEIMRKSLEDGKLVYDFSRNSPFKAEP